MARTLPDFRKRRAVPVGASILRNEKHPFSMSYYMTGFSVDPNPSETSLQERAVAIANAGAVHNCHRLQAPTYRTLASRVSADPPKRVAQLPANLLASASFARSRGNEQSQFFFGRGAGPAANLGGAGPRQHREPASLAGSIAMARITPSGSGCARIVSSA